MSDQIISQEGYEKLKNELRERVGVKRLEIAARIESAKELGDLSENAEYHDAKEEQAFNEGRVLEIQSTLKNVTIVQKNDTKNEVSMGSRVYVKTNNEEKIFTIVSFNEADPVNGKISNESPIGLALTGKRKGDRVSVITPKGEAMYEILKIE